MNTKFQALISQQAWELVPKPKNQIILGCKWVFKTKYNLDDSTGRYKVRLIAQGNQQEFGFDYFDMFIPMEKFLTLHILLTITATYHWPIL